MKAAHPVTPVKLFCGLILSDLALLDPVRRLLAMRYGAVDRELGPVPFDFTDYYGREMGDGLQRVFVSFGPRVDPGRLAAIKRETIEIERQFVVAGTDRRRVNLDPGYVTPAKLVLATTKDFSHRLYLGDGIYGEVTLNFRKGGCLYHPWTYPDFKSGRYDAFFQELRDEVLQPGAGEGTGAV